MAGISRRREAKPKSKPMPKRMARGRAAAFLALALLAPRVSEACAVCVSARDDGTQLGFLLGTLIMMPLPFIVVGGIVFFLWRRSVNQSSVSR